MIKTLVPRFFLSCIVETGCKKCMVKSIFFAAPRINPNLYPLNVLICIILAILKPSRFCIQFKIIMFPVRLIFLTVNKLVIKFKPWLITVCINKKIIIKPAFPLVIIMLTLCTKNSTDRPLLQYIPAFIPNMDPILPVVLINHIRTGHCLFVIQAPTCFNH